MKIEAEKATGAPEGNGFLVAIVAAFSLGLGVTGTMLWLGNQSQSSRPSVVAASGAPSLDMPSSGVGGSEEMGLSLPGLRLAPNGQDHLPPAPLTAGMSERQTALTLANWYYDHHNHPMAVKSFCRAIELGVTHPNVRTDLGNALRLNGQPEEALKQYQLAQKQDPTNEPSLFNQGALYAASLNNPQKGIEIWRIYLKRFPKGQSAEAARSLIKKASAKSALPKKAQAAS